MEKIQKIEAIILLSSLLLITIPPMIIVCLFLLLFELVFAIVQIMEPNTKIEKALMTKFIRKYISNTREIYTEMCNEDINKDIVLTA